MRGSFRGTPGTLGVMCATLVSCVWFSALAAGAQSPFPNQSTSVDYSRYRSVWPCDVALQGAVKATIVNAVVWRDTVPMSAADDDSSFAPPLRAIASRCAVDAIGQLSIATVKPVTRLVFSTYDTANIFRLLDTLMNLRSRFEERTAEWTATELVRASMSVLADWEYASPRIPFEKMQRLIDRYRTIDIELWGYYLTAIERYGVSSDSLAIMVARIIEQRVQQLVEVEGKAALGRADPSNVRDGSWFRAAILRGIRIANTTMLNDSLRICGSECYLRIWRQVHRYAIQGGWVGDGGTSSGVAGVGFDAMPLNPIDWHPSPPSSMIPAKGVISLLLFVDSRSYWNTRKNAIENFELFAVLRRLKAAYPELDITIVTRTLGYFGWLPPLTPREEGAQFAKWLLELRQLPARLAVDSTPYFFLPEPDRRRVNQKSDIDEAYGLGTTNMRDDRLGRSDHAAVLIGTDGRSIWRGELTRKTEQIVTDRISALSTYEKTQSSSPSH